MKPFYLFAILLLTVSSCSKDVLKPYDERIIGTWQLTGVNRVGIGGSVSSQPFTEGSFRFEENGTLFYTDASGNVYNGSWNIRKQWMNGNCVTYDNGNTDCNDRYVHTLQLTAVNFATQDVRSEYFDDMQFTETDRFKAFVQSGLHSYVYKFSR